MAKKRILTNAKKKNQIILYKNKVEVRLEENTVWLAQKQIAELFHTERSVITKHVRNILNTKELIRSSVCAKFAHTAEDGKVYKTQFYNLDMIISVGYRVNSKQGTQFRIWATDVLRKYLVNGYTINEKRLKAAKHKYRELQKSLHLLGNVMALEQVSGETKGFIKIITQYSRALDILDDYDHQRLMKPKGSVRTKYILTYEAAREIIMTLKKKFRDSDLVGQEKDNSFRSSLGAVNQTFDSKALYPTVQEKAAQLLYLVTKNHSFVDGNKRIAAALFVCYLQKNDLLLKSNGIRRIDDNTLVALTLLIATSKPQEKETMIKVVMNLLR
jgi:prophage maintenance system killer protein